MNFKNIVIQSRFKKLFYDMNLKKILSYNQDLKNYSMTRILKTKFYIINLKNKILHMNFKNIVV